MTDRQPCDVIYLKCTASQAPSQVGPWDLAQGLRIMLTADLLSAKQIPLPLRYNPAL